MELKGIPIKRKEFLRCSSEYIRHSLSIISKNLKACPEVLIGFGFLLAALLLLFFPQWQVSRYKIDNTTVLATLENQYRATLAQILGGATIGIGLYFTWENLVTAKEGQITERFTRAIDQLGKKQLEIKLGGIYALERISKESDEDYWPIMEIFTAYIRKNSSIENGNVNQNKVSLDIQAILTVIGRRKYSFNNGEIKVLDLQKTCLQHVSLFKANLEGANFEGTYLQGADLEVAILFNVNLKGAILIESKLEGTVLFGASLERASLKRANLKRADLKKTNFIEANLEEANLEGANLEGANLKRANLERVNFEGANLEGANLEGANLEGANLERVYYISCDQLSKVKTLYNADLDDELKTQLRTKYPYLFYPTEKNLKYENFGT